LCYFSFFFQAEDGIRDLHVTGVQTCALPIFVDRLIGEATFMRAYFNHQLLRNYGDFPIVNKTYGLEGEDYEAPRATFEECVNFIIAVLDKAAELLEGKSMASGRTNRVAALALKARVLTY